MATLSAGAQQHAPRGKQSARQEAGTPSQEPPALSPPPSQIVTARPAGAQSADDEGRTLLPMKVAKSILFRQIGPAISGGRVTSVAGVPGDSFTYYVGTADGGAFRTIDGGTTWKALFQHEHVASVGDIAVDPLNPQVVWIGTGESKARNDVSFGDGVYKSTDGGAHWKHVGLNGTYQIARIVIDPHQPNTVIVAAMGSPWADDLQRGVYRTRDGGNTWEHVLSLGPGVGVSDLAIDPKNSQVLYAAAYKFRRTPWSYSDGGPEDAIYKSSDQGQTWLRLNGHGLPKDPVGRIGVAVAPSNPNIVYAVMGSNEGVVWRTNDAGEHWNLVSKDQEADARPFYFSRIAVDPKTPEHLFALSNELMESTDGGRTFKKIAKQVHVDVHTMWIDPQGSGRIMEGNDGGVILSRDNGAHWAFLHNIAIGQFYHVYANNERPYMVCGGLQDNSAWCGPSATPDQKGVLDRDWFTLNLGDGIHAVPAPDNPDLIYNSTQNGVLMVFDRATQQAHEIEPYPRSFVGGGVADLPYRFNWNAGFAVSPSDAKVLYAGGNVVFRGEDRGTSWQPISPDLTRNDKSKQQSSGGPVVKDNSGAEVYDTILTITVAPKDPNVIWVGTDDGLVHVTKDGGAHWTNISPKFTVLPEWARIESIDVSPENPGQAVIAANRHYSGDFKPYLFRTNDYGATWTSMTGDLPANVYAHVVRQDGHNPHMYFAGLENGVYVSWDDGTHWYLMGLGLPNASAYDLKIQPQENDLIVGTHGRSIWIFDDLTPLERFTPEIGKSTEHLFPIRPALRFWPWSQVEWLGDGAFYGKNPGYGATITYYVGEGIKEPGKLVITDAQGKVVRTMEGMRDLEPGEEPPDEETSITSAGTPPSAARAEKPESEEARPATPPASAQQAQQIQVKPGEDTGEKQEQAAKAPWVPVQPGMHRIYWDLRSQGPVRLEGGKEFNKGPKTGALVPPGIYTATLSIGGQTGSEKFEVVNDPRVHVSAADLEAQYAAAESVVHELSQLDIALNRIDAVRSQLSSLQLAVKGTPDEATVKSAAEQLQKQISAVQEKITSHPEAEESILRKPGVVREHLFSIRRLLEDSDQAPTKAILEQKQLVDKEYQSALQAFNNFLTSDLPAFNQQMAQRKLPGIVTGQNIEP
ncbi:MAG TPA: hypothetical protein VFI95_13390 [Terriglobales bacterium]|nr:hypothetical protein [Terriglobales bacterium]